MVLYTQDSVSVRFPGPRGEEAVSGKLEISREPHGFVVSWVPYPPSPAKPQCPDDPDDLWEDLSADSTVTYHPSRKGSAKSLQSVKIKAEKGSAAAVPPPIEFEVSELNSYQCRQVNGKHELSLNLSDGSLVPTFVFLERRHEHFLRALREYLTFKRTTKPTTSQAGPSSSSPSTLQQRKRKGPNWSQQEKLDLVAEVGKRRLILRSRGADSATKGAKQAAWREVIAAVNASLNSSKERSKAEVKKQWQNLLERAKKERQLLLDTHGGEMNGADLPLSLISQRVLDVISESVMDEASTPDVDGSPEILEPFMCLKEEPEPEVILGAFEADHRTLETRTLEADRWTFESDRRTVPPRLAARNSPQQSGVPPPTPHDRGSSPTTSTLHNRFRDRRLDATATSSGDFVVWEDQRHSTDEQLERHFFESALRTCEELSNASRDLVRMRKKEHALKMALLRSKNKYYELKLRKLQHGEAP
ncbi:hypothetical protein IscW_ISCW017001 [Ixodes scapularis]|uniref:Regulatory protein zeste n=1 Tax=Ixodes scapularis TaxID=6945 RepID=B7PAD9_IXOSC|nr:hypothetical protein IscW_ISCW017001 [Ixodes scapularis]|eukprot:XP_002406774.1 hypothetical protein IscW_ISCW017001 [Ixodes scapularis]